MNDKFDYFIERTEGDIKDLKDSHAKLHEKIDTLLAFKFQIIGGAVVLSAFVSLVITVIAAMVKKL